MSDFNTTRWSLILAARDQGQAATAALAELCGRYRAPVLDYVRRSGRGHDAEDLTQAFFVRLLEQRWERGADPARGRFRHYLLGALKHYLADARAADDAQKRGGGVLHLPLDAADTAPAPQATPERAFERAFAFAVIERAWTRLRAEAVATGTIDQLDALAPAIAEPFERGALQPLATRLGVRANTLAVALNRRRQRLSQLVREELADTVGDTAQLDDEVRALREALRG